MRGYPLHLYPASLEPFGSDQANARIIVATPPSLPWGQLWSSVGATLYALAGAYSAAKKLLGSPGDPCIAEESFLGDDPKIVQLSYNSPIDIGLVVDFLEAFILVYTVSSGLITTTIEVKKWIERKKDLKDEDQRRYLEIEKLRLEVEEKKRQIAQAPPMPQLPAVPPVPESPQMIIISQLLFLGGILAREGEVWVPFSREYSGLEHHHHLWDDKTSEIEYGAFERDENGRIWFCANAPPIIIGDIP